VELYVLPIVWALAGGMAPHNSAAMANPSVRYKLGTRFIPLSSVRSTSFDARNLGKVQPMSVKSLTLVRNRFRTVAS
jgi:hypothetical protein